MQKYEVARRDKPQDETNMARKYSERRSFSMAYMRRVSGIQLHAAMELKTRRTVVPVGVPHWISEITILME